MDVLRAHAVARLEPRRRRRRAAERAAHHDALDVADGELAALERPWPGAAHGRRRSRRRRRSPCRAAGPPARATISCNRSSRDRRAAAASRDAKRDVSMFQAPAAPIARTIASTRPSHSRVEHRLVRLRLDLAEAVHAAHVVHAVHDAASAGVFGKPVPIMRIARDQLGELLLAPAFGAGGPHRQHQEARLGGRIPHPDLGVLRQRHAEIGEHAARVLHRARAIGRGLYQTGGRPSTSHG